MSDSLSSAREIYLRSIAVVDPVRVHFWDSRGTTMTQLRVMYVIRQKCDPSTGELAEELNIRPATLTGLADRLEQKGLIRRWSDASDRRVVRVGLTDEGGRLLDEVTATGTTYLNSIFARMGPDAVGEFTRALQFFIDTAAHVQAEGEPLLAEAGTSE